MKVFPICFGVAILSCIFGYYLFETFVNEKCINLINMKLTEDFFIFRLSTQRVP